MNPFSLPRALLVIVLASHLWSAPADAQDEAAIKQQIVDAWTARQARFQSGRIEWEEVQTYARGQPHAPGGKKLPREYSARRTLVLTFQGESGRYDRAGEYWSYHALDFVHKTYSCTYNGVDNRMLYGQAAHDGHPPGFRRTKLGSLQGGGWNYHIDPCLVTVRPCSPAFDADDPSAWTLLRANVDLNGQRTHVFEFHKGRYRVWIAPDQDFLVVRRDLGHGQDIVHRMEVTYEQDPQYGWLPSAWTILRFATPTYVASTIASNVVSYSFNEPIPEETFTIEFPTGAVLYDDETKVKSLVLEDGSLRPIQRGELRAGVTLDDLMTTDPPDAPGAVSRSRLWWAGIATLLATGVALVLIRRRTA